MSYLDTIAALPGVVGYWSLDETSGVFVDSIGANDGSASGTITRGADGLVSDGGKAVVVAATSSAISIPSSSDMLFGTGAFWICGWFGSLPAGVTVICGWYLQNFLGPNGSQLQFYLNEQTGSPTRVEEVTDGGRHFICFGREADGTAKLYLDDDPDPLFSFAAPGDISAYTAATFAIGATNIPNLSSVGATFDGWAMGKGAMLTPSQVGEVYEAGISAPGIAAGTLSAAGHTDTTASFTWTAGTGDSVTAQLQRSPAGAGAWSDVAGATSSPATATGLAPLTAYDFRVLYTDASAATAASNTITVTTDEPAGNYLTISDPPAYRVHQRGPDGTAAVPVAGDYWGTPDAIEGGVGGYTALDASPSGGEWSGVATVAAPGGTLAARFADDHAASASLPGVLVGDLWGIMGQSNAVGQGLSSQPYDPESDIASGKYTRAGAWAALSDPVDSTDDKGSIWPLLAARLVDRTGVPSGWVPTGVSGTSITAWLPGAGLDAAIGRFRAAAGTTGAGGYRGVFWWQGETDAIDGMSQATYYGHLTTIADAIWADLGCPLIVFVLQHCDDGSVPGQAAIRAAQRQAIAEHPHVLAGGDFSAVETDDAVHITSTPKLEQVADIAAAATVASLLAPATANPGEIDDVTAQEIIDGVAAAILASPEQPIATDSSGRVLLQPTQTGVTIPTVTNVGTVATLTGHTAQTGDTFARIGAPAGASIAADVATVHAKTTNLPASPAAVGSAMTLADASITSAKFATITPGLSGFLERLALLAQRHFGKVTKTTTQIKTYAADNTSVVATQAITDDGNGNQTLGAAS